MTSASSFEGYLRARHRPAHGRRTVESHALFLVPWLQPGMRLLDVGCGPASITAGFASLVDVGAGIAIGVDRDPGALAPTCAGDAYSLPFASGTFDAVFSCAMLQHLSDPLAALVEMRRVCRSGAVVGVADCDWDSSLLWPRSPLLARADAIRSALREGTSPRVGKELRGLLSAAGFVRASASVKPPPVTTGNAFFESAFFSAPEVVDEVVRRGLSTADEMAAIAAAWLEWGQDPGAFSAGFWVEAVAFVD